MTSFFSAEDGAIWIQFHRLVHNDRWTAVIWSKSKPEVEFQLSGRFGEFKGMSSRSHLPHCRVLPPVMISESHATLQGAATWRIQWHVIPAPGVNLQGIGLLPLGEFTVMIPEPLTTLHIENRLCHILLYFVFLMQFGHWRAAAFVSSPIHKRPPIQSHMWPTELHLCSLLWA